MQCQGKRSIFRSVGNVRRVGSGTTTTLLIFCHVREQTANQIRVQRLWLCCVLGWWRPSRCVWPLVVITAPHNTVRHCQQHVSGYCIMLTDRGGSLKSASKATAQSIVPLLLNKIFSAKWTPETFPACWPRSLEFCNPSNNRIIPLIPNTNRCNHLTPGGHLHGSLAAPSHDLHS